LTPDSGTRAGAASSEPEDEVEASRAPLMDHLVELRTRLVRVMWVLIVLFVAGWYVSQPALDVLLKPMGDAAVRAGREAGEFEGITTAPLEMVMVRLKLAFLFGLAAGFPFIAYQVYAFVAPGLYKKERMAVLPFLFVMPILFVSGALIVYYFVLPAFMDLSFSQELQGTTSQVDVKYLPKVKEYYDLAISLLTAFGVAFQLPVVMMLLSRANVVSASALRKGRKYAWVGILIVSAVMTPPDPFSLFLLSIPLVFLYEGGIWGAVLVERGRARAEAEDAKREAEEEAARKAEAASAKTPSAV
jgi:sec-independent protein translocase protein TatC